MLKSKWTIKRTLLGYHVCREVCKTMIGSRLETFHKDNRPKLYFSKRAALTDANILNQGQ